MRFLLFNVTVTAALIYLFTVGGTGDQTSIQKKAKDLFASAMTAADAAMDKVPSLSKEGTAITATTTEVAKMAARKIATDHATTAVALHRITSVKPVASDHPKGLTVLAAGTKDKLADTQPPPLSPVVEIEPVQTRPAPSISQEPEDEDVVEGAPSPSVDSVTPSQKNSRLMSPRERRSELQRLARDMEDLFVSRLGP